MLLLEPYHFVALLLLLVPAGRCLAATGDDGQQFVYSGFTGVNLTLNGAVEVTQIGLLMLTNGSLRMKGQAFHPFPLPFRNATGAVRSFSTIFAFGIIGQYDDLSSDGMAFFVSASKEALSTALPGPYLGLLNDTNDGNQSARIFAVELDTFLDAELQDINDNHVGIDVDSLMSRLSHSSGYYDDDTGMFQNLSLISRKAMQVWVDYDGTAMEITVTIAPLGMARPKKPLLQTIFDLSDVVQSTMYVGFSSATGRIVSHNLDIARACGSSCLCVCCSGQVVCCCGDRRTWCMHQMDMRV